MTPPNKPTNRLMHSRLRAELPQARKLLIYLTLGLLPLFSWSRSEAISADDQASAVERFRDSIEPILEQNCYACHAYGVKKGGVAFDELESDELLVKNPQLWEMVLKNVRSGIMPPAQKPRLSSDDKRALADWIKTGALGVPADGLDPGRPVLRRLNRQEYRATIHDLTGIDFRTDEELPPDDSGHGFDNNGEVLTLSPLLLEKYLHAAQTIVTKAVPTIPKVVPEHTSQGSDFRSSDGAKAPERLPFYKEAKLQYKRSVEHDGTYEVNLDLGVFGAFDFDPGKCRVVFKIDGEERFNQELGWEDHKKIDLLYKEIWKPGEHVFDLSLEPLTPIEKKKTFVDLKIESLLIRGPLEEKYQVATRNYSRFFPRETPPEDRNERLAYAREILAGFALEAFRRPADDATIDRLTKIAASVFDQPGKRFEEGVAQAMVAILASPRFLFRVEGSEPGTESQASSPVDEFTLASRLSYFLWSTAPDEELLGLAQKGELRKNKGSQVKRMLADPRSKALVSNFVGQWLQTRDVESIPINAVIVMRNDGKKVRFGLEFDRELRNAMRRETEEFFAAIVKDDLSVLDLLDSNYTYLNEKLAKHYGVDGVQGREMRKVDLPKDSPRGGILAQGSVLAVTSNPTRTSPVKRGQFILDNILGAPAPPPPPNVPALEDAGKDFKDKKPTVRQMMEIHRAKPLCNSCHSRMDPLGLALENFNALGEWRENEREDKIDASGKLITGEEFKDVRDVKKILRENHAESFYRCLAEKLLTYAIGRGVDYHDVQTVDAIVEELLRENGKFSALLSGIINSPAFERRRNPPRGETLGAAFADPKPQSVEVKP